MILYRPVGTGELKLIADSGYTAFPPRLPEQPIFYPVLNEKYACEIAFGWNVKYNEDHKGYVTKFEIDDDYAAAFEIHNVGAQHHNELWVPAEELPDFNRHIVGKIEVMSDSDEMIYVAEVMYETGELHFRYSRKPSADGWIRQGLFCEYYPNGNLASEGMYVDGLEEGMWKDYHENGQLAAEGYYVHGKEKGLWRFYDEQGNFEEEETYE